MGNHFGQLLSEREAERVRSAMVVCLALRRSKVARTSYSGSRFAQCPPWNKRSRQFPLSRFVSMCRCIIFCCSRPTNRCWIHRRSLQRFPSRFSLNIQSCCTNWTWMTFPPTTRFYAPDRGIGLCPASSKPCEGGWCPISNRASCRAIFSRSSRTCSPSGNAIWIVTIAGLTTIA